jgi:hypothetical protein
MREGHVRRGPSFVDIDEALGIKVELALEPVLPPLQNVGPILLTRVHCLFFARQLVTLAEELKRGDAQRAAQRADAKPRRSLWHENPSSIVARTRMRRSKERDLGMKVGLLRQPSS